MRSHCSWGVPLQHCSTPKFCASFHAGLLQACACSSRGISPGVCMLFTGNASKHVHALHAECAGGLDAGSDGLTQLHALQKNCFCVGPAVATMLCRLR